MSVCTAEFSNGSVGNSVGKANAAASRGYRRESRSRRRRAPLAGQLLGVDLKSGDGFGIPAESYGFTNKRTAWEVIPPLLDRASPLRTSYLRDPVGPQIHFASESFMDEVAVALNMEPGRISSALCEGPARRCRHQGGSGESGLAV